MMMMMAWPSVVLADRSLGRGGTLSVSSRARAVRPPPCLTPLLLFTAFALSAFVGPATATPAPAVHVYAVDFTESSSPHEVLLDYGPHQSIGELSWVAVVTTCYNPAIQGSLLDVVVSFAPHETALSEDDPDHIGSADLAYEDVSVNIAAAPLPFHYPAIPEQAFLFTTEDAIARKHKFFVAPGIAPQDVVSFAAVRWSFLIHVVRANNTAPVLIALRPDQEGADACTCAPHARDSSAAATAATAASAPTEEEPSEIGNEPISTPTTTQSALATVAADASTRMRDHGRKEIYQYINTLPASIAHLPLCADAKGMWLFFTCALDFHKELVLTLSPSLPIVVNDSPSAPVAPFFDDAAELIIYVNRTRVHMAPVNVSMLSTTQYAITLSEHLQPDFSHNLRLQPTPYSPTHIYLRSKFADAQDAVFAVDISGSCTPAPALGPANTVTENSPITNGTTPIANAKPSRLLNSQTVILAVSGLLVLAGIGSACLPPLIRYIRHNCNCRQPIYLETPVSAAVANPPGSADHGDANLSEPASVDRTMHRDSFQFQEYSCWEMLKLSLTAQGRPMPRLARIQDTPTPRKKNRRSNKGTTTATRVQQNCWEAPVGVGDTQYNLHSNRENTVPMTTVLSLTQSSADTAEEATDDHHHEPTVSSSSARASHVHRQVSFFV